MVHADNGDMGCIGAKSKIKRKPFRCFAAIFQAGILSFVICPVSLVPPPIGTTTPLPFKTSTVRTWTTHQFLIDIISNINNWSKAHLHQISSTGKSNFSENLRAFPENEANSETLEQFEPFDEDERLSEVGSTISTETFQIANREFEVKNDEENTGLMFHESLTEFSEFDSQSVSDLPRFDSFVNEYSFNKGSGTFNDETVGIEQPETEVDYDHVNQEAIPFSEALRELLANESISYPGSLLKVTSTLSNANTSLHVEDRSTTGLDHFDISAPISKDEADKFLQLVDYQRYRAEENFEPDKTELVGIPWINGSVLLRRIQNVHTSSPAFHKLYAINSFRISQGTAPSIPLYTRPPQFETTLESPLKIKIKDEAPRAPVRHIGNIPAISWGLAPVKFASSATTAVNAVVSSPTTLSPSELIWSHPVNELTRPVPVPAPPSTAYRVVSSPLPPVAELASSKSSSSLPPSPEPSSSSMTTVSDLLFKIWSYTDDGLKLQYLKQIPSNLLHGYNVSDGQVLNLEHLPLPIRKSVASAFNLPNSVIKRQSGPGSFEAFHWQQLPSVIPFTSSTIPPSAWTPPPVPLKQMAVNYVLWSSTTPAPPTPTPQHLSEIITQLLLQQSVGQPLTPQVTTPAPSLGGDGNRIKETDLLATMALIMSKINKDFLNFPGTQKPLKIEANFPDKHISPEIQGNVSPEFWASLLPMYMSYLKHGQAPIHRESLLSTKSSSSSLPHHGTENKAYSSTSDDYSFYPSPAPHYSTQTSPLAYDDSFKTGFVLKKIKKKFKKKSKKNKSTKSSSSLSFLDPGKFDFNYVFGNIDILGALRRAFYTVLALKAAPFIILTFLALVPLILLLLPQIVKGVTLVQIANWISQHLHHPKKIHHHYYPPTYKYYHHRQHQNGWSPSYGGWTPTSSIGGWSPGRPQYRGWSSPSTYGGWSTGRPQYVGWTPPPSFGGWSPSSHYRRIESGDIDPIASIGSLVQETYGNPAGDGQEGSEHLDAEEEASHLTTSSYSVDQADLDTVHNQKVMEILMNAKNITLQKLLESWELDFPAPSTTLAERSDASGRESVQRKKRSLRSSRHLKRYNRIVQIPASTTVT